MINTYGILVIKMISRKKNENKMMLIKFYIDKRLISRKCSCSMWLYLFEIIDINQINAFDNEELCPYFQYNIP